MSAPSLSSRETTALKHVPRSARRKAYVPPIYLNEAERREQCALWGQEKSLKALGLRGYRLLAEVTVLERVHLVLRDRHGAVWLAHLSNPFLQLGGAGDKWTDYDVWSLCFGPVRPNTQIDPTNSTTTPYIKAALTFAAKAFA